MESSLFKQGSKDKEDESLNVRTLSNVLSEVADWESLGINLGIEMYKLDEIKAKCSGDPVMCKYRMLDMWLRLNTEASWKDVFIALEKIGEKKVAHKIMQVQPEGHCPPQRQSSVEISTDSPKMRVRAFSNGGNGATTVVVNIPAQTNHANPPIQDGGNTMERSRAVETRTPREQCGGFISPNGLEESESVPSSLKPKTSENCLVDLFKSITLEDPQQIEVTCKVYNADTNKLIQSNKAPVTRDINIRQSRARVQEFSSEQVTRGSTLRLAVSADSNCYIYIVNIGTSGNTSVLLPNEYEKDNQFAAHQVYYFPGEDYGFEVGGPPGKETIQVMALSYKLESLNRMAETKVCEKEIYRDISIKRKKAVAASSSERKGFAQIQFDVK